MSISSQLGHSLPGKKIKCAHCGSERPESRMQVWTDPDTKKVVAICKDENACDLAYGKQGH